MTNVDVSSVFVVPSGLLKYYLLKPRFHVCFNINRPLFHGQNCLCFARASVTIVQETVFLLLLVIVIKKQFEEEQKVHNVYMWLRVKIKN